MARHAILGAGNLGQDLARELTRRGHATAAVFSRCTGFDATSRNDLEVVLGGRYDVIWLCIGYGSVAEAKETPEVADYFHRQLPLLLATRKHARTRLVVFSSDYAASERWPDQRQPNPSPRSTYAGLKVAMEAQIAALDAPRVSVIRVGSLFGEHKPQATLPGKILRNFGMANGPVVRLPSNLITPTPTLWLAGVLAQHPARIFDDAGSRLHHCAPAGNVSVADFGTFVLDGLRHSSSFDRSLWYDDERPHLSALGCSFLEHNWHWHEVWSVYWKRETFMPRAPSRPTPEAPHRAEPPAP